MAINFPEGWTPLAAFRPPDFYIYGIFQFHSSMASALDDDEEPHYSCMLDSLYIAEGSELLRQSFAGNDQNSVRAIIYRVFWYRKWESSRCQGHRKPVGQRSNKVRPILLPPIFADMLSPLMVCGTGSRMVRSSGRLLFHCCSSSIEKSPSKKKDSIDQKRRFSAANVCTAAGQYCRKYCIYSNWSAQRAGA